MSLLHFDKSRQFSDTNWHEIENAVVVALMAYGLWHGRLQFFQGHTVSYASYFIEEEAETAGKTPKGYTIQIRCHTVYNTTHINQTTRTRPVPSSAKNDEEMIHRVLRPLHNPRRKLHETDSDSRKAQANASSAHERLRLGEWIAGRNPTRESVDHKASDRKSVV